MSKHKSWYLRHQGNVHGPVSSRQVREMMQSSEPPEGVEISPDGKAWTSIKKVRLTHKKRSPEPSTDLVPSPRAPVVAESKKTKGFWDGAGSMLGGLVIVAIMYAYGWNDKKADKTSSSYTAAPRKDVVSGFQYDVTNEPIEINPTGDTDEVAFLLYNYAKLRSQIPATINNRGEVQKNLAQLRDRVNRYHEYAKDRAIDLKVQSMYADLLNAIDLTSDYLTQLDRIDRGLLAQSERLSAETGYHAGFTGGYTGSTAYQEGASGGEAALVGIAAAAITYYFEDMKNRQSLDESRVQAFEEASEGFKRQMSKLQARETNLLSDFASSFGWIRNSSGQWLDPFSKLERTLAEQYGQASTPSEALAACQAIQEAARRVPAAAIYDEYRGNALFWAARAATWAAQEEIKGTHWGAVQVPSANLAVRLWDAALRYAPEDPVGFWRSQRAWALGIAGRFSEAQKQANDIFWLRQNDSAFQFHYASLWSASGSPNENILSNVRAAISNGNSSSDIDASQSITLQTIKTDPNLKALRDKFPTEFDDLVRVKWEWSTDWGILSDDIQLVNKSAFPITNVKLEVTVDSTRDGKWGPYRFECPKIAPGQMFRWNTRIGSRGDDARCVGRLTTDQNR